MRLRHVIGRLTRRPLLAFLRSFIEEHHHRSTTTTTTTTAVAPSAHVIVQQISLQALVQTKIELQKPKHVSGLSRSFNSWFTLLIEQIWLRKRSWFHILVKTEGCK